MGYSVKTNSMARTFSGMGMNFRTQGHSEARVRVIHYVETSGMVDSFIAPAKQ